MNTDTSEYLGQPNQPPEKKFRVERALDPETQKILSARMAVATDPALTFGARNFFTLLLDMSLDPDYYDKGRKGQIAISNVQLQERLSASARAIYGWTKMLEAQLHIWVSKKPRPNMHAMNVFHISALQPKKFQGPELPGDGVWGNGYRRPAQPMPKGARGGIGKKRHYLLDRFGNPIFTETPENEAPTRNFCQSSPQNLREGPAQKDTCHPQNLREPSAKSTPSLPQNLRGAPAKNDTAQQQKGAVLKESRDRVRDQKEVLGKPPTADLEFWVKQTLKWYPNVVDATLADLVKQRRDVDPEDSEAVASLDFRIGHLEKLKYGAERTKKRPVAPRPAPKLEPKDLSEDELLVGARWAKENGRKLTETQKAALARAEVK